MPLLPVGYIFLSKDTLTCIHARAHISNYLYILVTWFIFCFSFYCCLSTCQSSKLFD